MWRASNMKKEKGNIIRRFHSLGQSQALLAKTYGVSQVCISKIVRGETW